MSCCLFVSYFSWVFLFRSLLSLIAEEGRLLSAVEPSEFSIKNTFLMVLKLVREENTRIVVGDFVSFNVQNLF